MSTQSEPTDELIGATLGPYRILSKLGEGAMGNVYRGVHDELGRPVAIKTLKPEVSAQASLVKRFFAEAKAVNLIRHENIVECTDLVRDPSGRTYMVMEMLEGQPLSKAITLAGKLPADRALGIARQIGLALSAAHSHEVVHRDLKPDNIFLIHRNQNPDYVKVLDFGIARLRIEQDGIKATQSGVAIGTPAYMSPEQVVGSGADARSDIYTLGVVLFEMLTGRLPFLGSNATEVMMNHLSSEPPTLQSQLKVPSALAGLVNQMLAKNPEDRPKSMAEVIARIDSLLGLPPTKLVVPPPATGHVADAYDETVDSVGDGDDAESSDSAKKRYKAAAAVGVFAVAGIAVFLVARGMRSESKDSHAQSTETAPPDASPADATTPNPRQELTTLYTAQALPPPPPSCQHPESELDLLIAAMTDLAGGKAGSARASDRTALSVLSSLKKESAEASMLIGRAKLFVDSTADIGPEVTASLSACPDFAAAHGIAGSMLLLAGKYAEARTELGAALVLHSDYQDARYNLAIAELGLSNPDDAVSALDQLRPVRDRFPDIDIIYGEAYLVKGDPSTALVHLQAAIQNATDKGRAYLDLGAALEMSDAPAAKSQQAFCRAAELGHPLAKKRCK